MKDFTLYAAGILDLNKSSSTTGMVMDEWHLRKFFHFTEEDLLANRRGQFSDRQKELLSQAARTEQASARSSAAILFVIATAGLAIGLVIGSIAPVFLGRILIVFFMGILWPAVWARKGVQILRSAYNLQTPRLCQVSGPVYVVQYGDTDYLLQVGNLEFDLDGNPAAVVMEGDEYTVYYLEATVEILSIEYLI